MRLMHIRLLFAALFVLALPCPAAAATAFVEGHALYRERIMPPPGATLIVTLEDVSRADAKSIEIASTHMLVPGGPPYRWRIGYDPALTAAPKRLALRARIVANEGLWMTTDTFVALPDAATGDAPTLRLVQLARAPDSSASAAGAGRGDCAAPATQADMARCAYEDFLSANAGYATHYAALSASLPDAQRGRLRKMQKAWIGYRTAACTFESGAAQGGSVQSQLNWLCAARMTRERAAQLARMASCREGDVSCNRRFP